MNNYDILSLIANILQVANYQMNLEQTSNDQLMKELRNQDKLLDEQTNIYLKKIIEQNRLIINLLIGGNNEISKENNKTN